MARDPVLTCPECQLGILHPRRAVYFNLQDGMPVIVPDFPAWICDVCGRREYDQSALVELEAMLEHGRRSPRGRSAGADTNNLPRRRT
jgi:YgiT-type zinc finger domain-containing protein